MLLHLLYIKFINKANKMPKGAKGDGEFWHRLSFLGENIKFDKLIKEEMI